MSTESFSLSVSSDIELTKEDTDLSGINFTNIAVSNGDSANFKFEDLISVDNVDNIELLLDRYEGSIALFDADSNPIETIDIQDLGNLDLQEIDLDLDNISSFKIDVATSSGVAVDSTQSIYSNLYVFGDSLVDTGNLFNATTAAGEASDLLGLDLPVVPPTPPYFEGRFADGELWIDNLADELGIDLTPASELSVASPGANVLSPVTLVDGNPAVSPFFNGSTTSQSVNFGYASATTGANGTGELSSFIPGIEQQVDFFVEDRSQANKTADEDALYVFWGGSNDYFGTDTPPEQVVDNLATELETLYDLGARDFLVANLPDLGALPGANSPDILATPAELTQLSDTHNSLLESSVEELEDILTGMNVTILDVNTLFDEVIANPEEFDLTNVSESYLDPVTLTPTADADPSEYLFFDAVHPTAVAHTLVSDLALETLAIEAEL